MTTKPLVIKLFEKDRHIGDFPGMRHADLRTVIEFYRRGKEPRFTKERLDEVEKTFADFSDIKSLSDLRSKMDSWKSERNSSFNADAYYDANRAKAYHQHNLGSQFGLCRAARGSLGAVSADYPLMFDSGCGTGLSAVALAQQTPLSLVLAADMSEHMLHEARQHYFRKQKKESTVAPRVPFAGLGGRVSGGAIVLDFIKLDMQQPLPLRSGIQLDGLTSTGALHYLFADKEVETGSATASEEGTQSVLETGEQRLIMCMRNSTEYLARGRYAAFQFFPPRANNRGEAGGGRADEDVSSLSTLEAAAKGAQLSLDVVADLPHHTKATRWVARVGRKEDHPVKRRAPSSEDAMEDCLCAWVEGTTGRKRTHCLLSVSADNTEVLGDHYEWLVMEHCRFAHQVVRKWRRAQSDSSVTLSQVENAIMSLLQKELPEGLDVGEVSLDVMKSHSEHILRIVHN